jgi:hypothetical protein
MTGRISAVVRQRQLSIPRRVLSIMATTTLEDSHHVSNFNAISPPSQQANLDVSHFGG